MLIHYFINSIFGMALISAFLPSLIAFIFGMVIKYNGIERKKLHVKFWVLGFLTVTMCVTGCIKYFISSWGTLGFNELKTSLWSGGALVGEYSSDILILFILAPIFFTYLTLQLLEKYKKQLRLV
jgi:hypothetical protein